MLNPRTILCPVDLSPHSPGILRHAFALARDAGASLVVLHVLDPLLAQAASMRVEPEYLEKEARRELDGLIAALPAAGRSLPEPPARLVHIGDSFRMILAASRELGADLLVMGTHGQTGAARLFFGSTLARVLRETTAPVLALGPESPGLCREEAKGPVIEVRNVIAALSLTHASDHVLRAAAAVAERQQCPLLLAHVVAPPQGLDRWQDLLEAQQKERLVRAEQRLRTLAEELDRHSVRTEIYVGAGPAEDVIAELADRAERTLVVLGLRSARAMLGQQPGSTAYRVLCVSKAPVLVVPPETTSQVGPSE
jgi:nucleotide-binding universal stress UspA family protein